MYADIGKWFDITSAPNNGIDKVLQQWKLWLENAFDGGGGGSIQTVLMIRKNEIYY